MTDPDPWRPPRLAGQTHDDDDLPDELRAIAARFAAQPTPRPTAADTARLVARLLAEEPAATFARTRARPRVGQTLRVARWRVWLLGPQFWVASVLLLGLSAWLSGSRYPTMGPAPLILLVPLTAVLGLAHALRTPSGGLREVEASAPTGFTETTAGLALAIVGFDGVLGAAATLALSLATATPFPSLLAAWLGPLLVLTALSLPVALRWGTLLAALVGGAPWALLVLMARLNPTSPLGVVLTLPTDAGAVALRLGLAVAGLVFLLGMLLHGPVHVAAATRSPNVSR